MHEIIRSQNLFQPLMVFDKFWKIAGHIRGIHKLALSEVKLPTASVGIEDHKEIFLIVLELGVPSAVGYGMHTSFLNISFDFKRKG
jgi:hypothetical protein